jgi:iron(III) transport system permease protein
MSTLSDHPAIPVRSYKALTRKAGMDDWIKRSMMLVIGLYLLVTLAAPLYVMLARSFNSYQFALADYAVQVGDGSGNWQEPETLAARNAVLGVFTADDLATSGSGRLSPAELFPDFSFRGPEHYRIRGLTPQTRFLIGTTPHQGEAWQEMDSNQFRRVMLMPSTATGLENYRTYFSSPALFQSIRNSVVIALISTILTVALAFGFAYALTRSQMRFKGFFRLVAVMPILVPSLLPGIGLIYLFGNQGILKDLLLGVSIYGPLGIVLGSVFFTFPHALMIISTALAVSDARLYEAADVLRASKWRTFWTVTVPGARYGLISAAFVVFNLVITDFGLPKVIGGQFNVLAVDVYKQVIGQQNFEIGAVVSVMLLVPAIVAFLVDRAIQRRQIALLSARAVPLVPKKKRLPDNLSLVYCSLIALFIVGLMVVCQLAAVVRFWPYDMTLSLRNFDFSRMDGGGWTAYANSIRLALLTAIVGTVIVFTGAYAVEKADGFPTGRMVFQFFAMLPMAVPGMVLGLAYIFFFNNPANPLHGIYGTMTILVICTVTHFYSVAHLTALTALKQMDSEFEAVSASLKQPFYKLFVRVTVPVCLPAILDISLYLFVNAMTTVSAVVFLYSAHTALASVAVLNMDDAGDIAPAAAMGMMIFYTNVAARLIYFAISRVLLKRTQSWRMREA